MKINELFEDTSINSVPWPTDLSWRLVLQRYKNLDPLLDVRRNKIFSMPFKNWANTYYSLTLKDYKKIPHMQTQVLRIPNDSIVGDMKHINAAFMSLRSGDSERFKKHLDEYETTMCTYAEFVKNPKMFYDPEILSEKGSVEFLPYKVVLTGRIDEFMKNLGRFDPELGVKGVVR